MICNTLIWYFIFSYDGDWTAFLGLDENVNSPSACAATEITDIYSAKCWQPTTDQCGNFAAEGDCYNREHSWPKSWFGGMFKF